MTRRVSISLMTAAAIAGAALFAPAYAQTTLRIAPAIHGVSTRIRGMRNH